MKKCPPYQIIFFLLFVINLTPIELKNYRVGVPEKKEYKLLLNSDETQFGGNGNMIPEKIKAEEYYNAQLEYKPLTFWNMFNPFSAYKNNLLEKEARKAARTKSGRLE